MKNIFTFLFVLLGVSCLAASPDVGLRPATSWVGTNIMSATNAAQVRDVLGLSDWTPGQAANVVSDLTALAAYSGAEDTVLVTDTGGVYARDTAVTADGVIVVTNAASGDVFKRQFTGAANLLWWGAVPDDSTDDRAAIVAALAYSDSAGVTIHVPAGVYDISAYIDLSGVGDISLQGVGEASVFRYMSSSSDTTTPILYWGPGYTYSNPKLSNILFTDETVSPGPTRGLGALGFKGLCDGLTLDGVTVTNMYFGVKINNGSAADQIYTNVKFNKVKVDDIGYHGLLVSHIQDFTFSECYFGECGSDALAAYALHGVYITGDSRNGRITSSYFAPALRPFSGSTPHSAPVCGLHISVDSRTGTRPSFIVVSGCTFDVGDCGVITTADKLIIVGNTFRRVSGETNSAKFSDIYVYQSTYVVVANSSFAGTLSSARDAGYALNVYKSVDVSAVGNSMYDKVYAIYADTSTNVNYTVNHATISGSGPSSGLYQIRYVASNGMVQNNTVVAATGTSNDIGGCYVTGASTVTTADNYFELDSEGQGVRVDSTASVVANNNGGVGYPANLGALSSGTNTYIVNHVVDTTPDGSRNGKRGSTIYDKTAGLKYVNTDGVKAWRKIDEALDTVSSVTTSLGSLAGEMMNSSAIASCESGWTLLPDPGATNWIVGGTSYTYLNNADGNGGVAITNYMQAPIRGGDTAWNRVYDVTVTLAGACVITNYATIEVALGGNVIGQIETTTSSFSATARCGSGTNLIFTINSPTTNAQVMIEFDTISVVPWASGDLMHSHTYAAASLVPSASAAPYFEFSASGKNAATADVKTNVLALATTTVTDVPEIIGQVVTGDNGGNWVVRGKVFAMTSDDYALELTYIDPTLTTNIVTAATDLTRWAWANAGYIYFGARDDSADAGVTINASTVEMKP